MRGHYLGGHHLTTNCEHLDPHLTFTRRMLYQRRKILIITSGTPVEIRESNSQTNVWTGWWRLQPRHRLPLAQEDCTRLQTRTLLVSRTRTMKLRRQSLQCSWTSSLELSTDGPQTAGLVIQQVQTVAEDIFVGTVGPTRSVNPPLSFNCASEISCLRYCMGTDRVSYIALPWRGREPIGSRRENWRRSCRSSPAWRSSPGVEFDSRWTLIHLPLADHQFGFADRRTSMMWSCHRQIRPYRESTTAKAQPKMRGRGVAIHEAQWRHYNATVITRRDVGGILNVNGNKDKMRKYENCYATLFVVFFD